MAENRDITTYDIDAEPAKAKLRELEQLARQVSDARISGGDPTQLEQTFAKEAESFDQVAGKAKAAGVATDGLVREKERLANVVGLLGGRFGGMIGQLGGVVELFTSATAGAAGLGIGIAAITAGVTVFQNLRDAAKEAADEMERVANAPASIQFAGVEGSQGLATQLAKFGVADQFQAARQVEARLGSQFGFAPDAARSAAALAVAGGFGDDEAAILAFSVQSGVSVGDPEAARKLLASVQGTPGAADAIRGEIGQYALTQSALLNAARSRAVGPGGPDISATRRVFESAKVRGLLPKGTEDSFAEFDRMLREAESEIPRADAVRARMRDNPRYFPEEGRLSPYAVEEKYGTYRQFLKLLEQEREAESGRFIPGAYHGESDFGPAQAAFEAYGKSSRPERAARSGLSASLTDDPGVAAAAALEAARFGQAVQGGMAGMVNYYLGTNYAAPDRSRITARRQALTPGGADINAPTR